MSERRPVPGYEGLYEIDAAGRVYSLARTVRKGPLEQRLPEARLSWNLNSRGYQRVSLWRDGRRRQLLVHRLVALVFLPNPHGLPVVNHKDENKGNPCLDNLEWATEEYNRDYSRWRREEGETSGVAEGMPMLSWT